MSPTNINRSSPSSSRRNSLEVQTSPQTPTQPTTVSRTQADGPPGSNSPRTSAVRTDATRAPRGAAPTTEATAAGHAASFVRLGGSHIAKMTSNNEAQMYEKFGGPLHGAIPNTVPAERVDTLPGVTPEQLEAFGRLRETAQASGQSVLVMEALGGGIPKEHKREMDVKIGSRTASRTELMDSGASAGAALKKKAKMTVADLARGSWSLAGENRGYSLTGRTIAGQNPDSSRFSAGRNSEANITQTLDLPDGKGQQAAERLLEDLNNIRGKMRETPVTFVASSVLMAVDEQEPANSAARLIDLAHPVQPGVGTSNYDKLDQRFDEGLGHLIDHVAKSTGQSGSSGTKPADET